MTELLSILYKLRIYQRKNMNSYNKQALDIIAKEQGFIRDNLEKVMRLVEILNYFHDSPLLSKSAVRG